MATFGLTRQLPIWQPTRMKLSEYLSANGLTYRQFAERIGKSVFQVHRWATDKRTPDLESAVEIERITDGAVRPCDFVEAAQ